jgi:hypothetical protein
MEECLTVRQWISYCDSAEASYEKVKEFEALGQNGISAWLRNRAAERAVRRLGLLRTERQTVPPPLRPPEGPSLAGPIAGQKKLWQRGQALEPQSTIDSGATGRLGARSQPDPEPAAPGPIRALDRPAAFRRARLRQGKDEGGMQNDEGRVPGAGGDQAASGSGSEGCRYHMGTSRGLRENKKPSVRGQGSSVR